MSYYMRFFATDKQPIILANLEAALKQIDTAYRLNNVQHELPETGDLLYGDKVVAQIEINRAGEELFQEEIEEFEETVVDAQGKNKNAVLRALRHATTVVAVQVLLGNDDAEATLQNIDPLWEWLFANRAGLLQADGEGFYDQAGLVLEVE